jgi:hypothetical protein
VIQLKDIEEMLEKTPALGASGMRTVQRQQGGGGLILGM